MTDSCSMRATLMTTFSEHFHAPGLPPTRPSEVAAGRWALSQQGKLYRVVPGEPGPRRTSSPCWAPPRLSSLPQLSSLFLDPPNSPGSPQATREDGHPTPPTPLGHGSLVSFAVCRLCLLPVPITFCSAVLSLLNADKCVLSFISVSSPLTPAHTLQGGQRNFHKCMLLPLSSLCPRNALGPGSDSRGTC